MFSPGNEYTQLPRQWGSRWRYCSRIRVTTDLGIDSYSHLEFYDCQGLKWCELEGRYLTTEPHYAWNECSPKVCYGLWWVTPDLPGAHEASFVHDQLCQFFNVEDFPFSKVQVDQIFYNLLKKNKFCLAGMHHGAVKQFGNYHQNEPCETSRIILG